MKSKIIRTSLQMGPLLKELRKENELTQIELYEQSNILPKTISALENGNSRCSIESLIHFANACGYHIELIKNEGQSNSRGEW